jgi:trans-aconitate methyltransferase
LSPKRKLLQLKAFLRLEKIRTVLDLGCGIGVTSNVLSQIFSNAKVTAIDCSQDAIAYAKKHFPSVDFQVRVIEPGQPIFWYVRCYLCLRVLSLFPKLRCMVSVLDN